MPNKLHVEIVTPYSLFFEGEADRLILPALDGEIGIMPGHSPTVIALNPGELRIVNEDEVMYASVADGFAQIEINDAIVVVSSAEKPEEIDVERAKKALKRADERIHDKEVPEREKERSQRGILRARARLKVASHLNKKF